MSTVQTKSLKVDSVQTVSHHRLQLKMDVECRSQCTP